MGLLDVGGGRVPARAVLGGTDRPGAGGPGGLAAAGVTGDTTRAGSPAAAEARHPVPAPAPRVGRPSEGSAGPPLRSTGSPADRDPGISRCAGGATVPVRERGPQLAGATQTLGRGPGAADAGTVGASGWWRGPADASGRAQRAAAPAVAANCSTDPLGREGAARGVAGVAGRGVGHAAGGGVPLAAGQRPPGRVLGPTGWQRGGKRPRDGRAAAGGPGPHQLQICGGLRAVPGGLHGQVWAPPAEGPPCWLPRC